MFEDFDFSVLDDESYKEDAVREDIVAPLLKALGFAPTGKHRMQRSQALTHPFVMIGSQKRKINIIPDYTLWSEDQAVLILDAKRPSESLVNSPHVEQAFSYAIPPDVRTRSYALCNGRELVLYDIDRSEPVFRVEMKHVKEQWIEVLKHLSPAALVNRHHREFQADLGMFLLSAGFTKEQDVTFLDTRISSLGQTLGGALTATASLEMVEGVSFQGSFDMPMKVLPALLSRLPSAVASMAEKALAAPANHIWIGGVIEVSWTTRLGEPERGLYEHDPVVPLCVTVIHEVSVAEPIPPPHDLPPGVLNVPSLLAYV